jgi:hypothetical protein
LVKELKQRDGRRIRGNVVSRVAYAVAQQTGLPARRLNAAIGQLYNIRNDVVRNAVEEPLKLDEMTGYMEIVAVQTFRFLLVLPSAPCIEAADFLTRHATSSV